MDKKETTILIDNTTMIGVAQLILDPKTHLSPYTLLDLECFCEAFILYDKIMSLRGQTLNYLWRTLAATKLTDMKSLLTEMRAAGIFSTRFATPAVSIHETTLFPIISNMGLEVEHEFSYPEIPVDNYLCREGAFEGTGKADLRRETSTTSLSTLYFQTLMYVVTAMHEGIPYMGSSIRVPIIRYLSREINHRSSSIIEKCLAASEKSLRMEVERVMKEFPQGDFRLVLPPLLRYVLELCNNPIDIFPSILKLRNRPDVERLRRWCQNFQNDVEVGNITGITRNLEALDSLSEEFALEPDALITTIESIITIGASPLSSVLDLVKTNSNVFLSWVKNRHFLFLKRLNSSLQTIESNHNLIERVFGKSLSTEDLHIYSELRKLDASENP